MIDSYLRPIIQPKLISPVAAVLQRTSVTPLSITALALITGLAVIPALLTHSPVMAAIFILLSGYCDILDGSLSRLLDQSSEFGALCDITSDRAVEFSIILALFLVNPAERGIYCIGMLGAILLCISTFLTVGIFSANKSEKSFYYSAGLMERTEAFAFFLGMVLFPSIFKPLALLFTALVSYTAFYRIWEFKKEQEQKNN